MDITSRQADALASIIVTGLMGGCDAIDRAGLIENGALVQMEGQYPPLYQVTEAGRDALDVQFPTAIESFRARGSAVRPAAVKAGGAFPLYAMAEDDRYYPFMRGWTSDAKEAVAFLRDEGIGRDHFIVVLTADGKSCVRTDTRHILQIAEEAKSA